ncbi:MAG: GAF domain-containing protein [Planctomycetota bacterium]
MRAASGVFERLHAIGKRITGSLDTHEVLHAILTCAIEATGAELGWISLAEEGETLRVATSHGVPAGHLPERIRFDEGITGLAAQTGKLYYAPDVRREPRFINVNDAIRCELAVPLAARGRLLGVFNLEGTTVDAFDPEALELAAALADQAAIALDNAAQYTRVDQALRASHVALERQVRALRALSAVTAAINASLERDAVLAEVIRAVRELTDGAACQLLLRDHETGGLIIHTPFALEGGLAEGAVVDDTTGITGWVVRHRRALNIPDVRRDDRYRCWIVDTRAEIALPLVKDDRLIGVLNCESPRLNAFDGEMAEMLQLLADHAATAIANAGLFARYKRTRERLEFAGHLASVGESTADLIHWFGNKAGLIMGCAENIRAAAGSDPSVAEDVDIIRRHMAEVLDMKKRVVGGKETEPLEPVPAAAVIAAAVRDLPAGVTVEPVPDGLVCRARPRALRNVLAALIGNGLDAVRGRAGGRVTVSAAPAGERVMIRVADNGPGYPREQLARLFKPFFSTKREGPGTGMGLWLAYRSLKGMNGEILAEGDTGIGLSFTIWLEALA